MVWFHVVVVFSLASICYGISNQWVDTLSNCCIDPVIVHENRHMLELAKCVFESIDAREDAEDVAGEGMGSDSDQTTFSKKKIALVSYGPAESKAFAPYSWFVSEVFAAHHNFTFHIAETDRSDYDMVDHRWNKFKVLSAALHPTSGWARDMDYVLWVDPSLALLNLSLNIENIIDEYPLAHIISSKKAQVKQGQMSSGAILVKNSKFSRQFLDQVWGFEDEDMEADRQYHSSMVSRFEHLLGDESRLDEVYGGLTESTAQPSSADNKRKKGRITSSTAAVSSDSDKVKLVDPHVFGSVFPLFLELKASSNAVQLRDEVPSLRRNILRQAYNQTCHLLHEAKLNIEKNKAALGKLTASKKKSAKRTADIAAATARAATNNFHSLIQSTPLISADEEALDEALSTYQTDIDVLVDRIKASIAQTTVSVGAMFELDRYLQTLVVGLERKKRVPEASAARLLNYELFDAYIREYRPLNEARMKKSRGVGLPDWPKMLSKTVEVCVETVGKATHVEVEDKLDLSESCKKHIDDLNKIVNSEFKETLRGFSIQLNVYTAEVEMSAQNYKRAQILLENAMDLCNKQSSPVSCFLYPTFLLGEAVAGLQEWTKAIGVYDGAVTTVIKTQTKKFDAPNEYDLKLIKHQGDVDVDTVLFKVMMGRAYSFARMGDINSAQKDLVAATKFSRKSPNKIDCTEDLKQKVRDAIVESAESSGQQNLLDKDLGGGGTKKDNSKKKKSKEPNFESGEFLTDSETSELLPAEGEGEGEGEGGRGESEEAVFEGEILNSEGDEGDEL